VDNTVPQDEQERESVTRVFTFGLDHVHPVTGEDMSGKCVIVVAGSWQRCRDLMFEHFGNRWSMDYPSVEAAGVGAWTPEVYGALTESGFQS